MKKNLLHIALTVIFLKLLLFPQFASGQNSRVWGTYYGGTDMDKCYRVATDAAANVYIVGVTSSQNNISFAGFENTPTNLLQYPYITAFLAKFDASGNRLWATYYGDCSVINYADIGLGVATDAAGNVYMCGATNCTDNVAAGGFQNTLGGGFDAFLVKFDANGNRLWATYYGGPNDDFGEVIATDALGNVYLAGFTQSSIGIASGGFQNTYGGPVNGGYYGDAFLVKFDADGNRLWATYYGGLSDDYANGVATDSSGNVYLGGTTFSSTNIASGGFQDTLRGSEDAFLVKFDANGNRIWATYYGGKFETFGNGVATTNLGNVYLAGGTLSPDGIASDGFQDTLGGINDAYLVKFDGNGNRLWATYYGGPNVNDYTDGYNVATDASGNVWLEGLTNSKTGIASGGFENNFLGIDQANFLVKFDATGNRQCATYYYGGSSIDWKVRGGAIALDNVGYVYFAGVTSSPIGIASGGFQDTYGGGNFDGDLIKFCPCTNCTIPPVPNFQSSATTVCVNSCINYTDLSTSNPTSWQWSFTGGTLSSSTMQNPQGICYYSTGTFDSRLIASNNFGSDTLTFINHIKVFPTPPTPVITQYHDTLYCTTDPSYTSYQWYDSTTLIPGATDTFLIITHGGNYNVAVHNEFGCQISVGINIAHNVGINEFSANNFFSLSPNPASDQLIIYTTSAARMSATISILNMLGQVCRQEEIVNRKSEIVIDVSSLPAGIYFLQMKTENGIDTKRFVKE